MAQAERIVKSKKRLPKGLLAFATAPLHKAAFAPDVIHGMSDVLQAYHLGNDWSAAHDIFPFEMTMTMNSSACHGVAAVYLSRKPNISPMWQRAATRQARPNKARSIGSGRATSWRPRSGGCSSARYATAVCPTPHRRDLPRIQHVQALSLPRLDQAEGVTDVHLYCIHLIKAFDTEKADNIHISSQSTYIRRYPI